MEYWNFGMLGLIPKEVFTHHSSFPVFQSIASNIPSFPHSIIPLDA
jgi:hypothetical protein